MITRTCCFGFEYYTFVWLHYVKATLF